MTYEQKLKEIRIEQNMLQKDLAEILGISEHTYSHYESGNATIPIKHLNMCCNYLNISLDYIFNFTNKKNYDNTNNEIDKQAVGNRLKEFRKENKITLIKLGNILNCSYGTIAGYESGRYLIATPFLYTICKNYSVSADYLLGKVDEPKYLKEK